MKVVNKGNSCGINTILRGSIVLAALVAANPAWAQTAESPTDPKLAETQPALGDDIIVTANKRSQNMLSVPVSIAALSGDALAEKRMTSADDLAGHVANLQVNGIVGDNVPIFALRGISMYDYSLNQSSPIAVYYDEVYKGNFAFLGVGMFDLERAEVLRGPQGTLYGKNTTGGAVNLISRMPKLGVAEGDLTLGYGNYNRIEANGGISLPIGDKLAARVAFTYAHADGWFKNKLEGKPDLNEVREYGIKGTLLFDPSDDVSFVLRGSTTFQNPRNYGIYAQPANVTRPGLKDREIMANITDRRRARTYAVSLTGKIDLSDAIQFTTITSYDKGTFFYYEDTDGQAIRLLEIPYFDRASQVAQDFRLTSNYSGPFNFIVGAYYNREKVYNSTNFQIAQDLAGGGDANNDGVVDNTDCITSGVLGCQFRNSFDQLKKSLAFYSDATYKLTDSLTLRGGLRYTHDTGEQTNLIAEQLGPTGDVLGVTIPTPSDANTPRFSTNNVSGKIGIDYMFANDNLIYASFSRGYRAKSFNAQAFFSPDEVSTSKAESVDAFEVGMKGRALDRMLSFSTAAFYYRYKDQQFLNVDPTTAAQTLLNIPASRIYGAEAELNFQPSQAFSLHGSIGLLDTKITKGVVSGVDIAGNRLLNAPTVNFNLSAEIELARGNFGSVTINPEMRYNSMQYFGIFNNAPVRQGGYAVYGGNITWKSDDERFRVALWSKNLGNKFYFTQLTDLLSGFGYIYSHLGNPRTYGVTASAKF